MLERETARCAHACPPSVRRLLGAYEGLRRSEMLPRGGRPRARGRRLPLRRRDALGRAVAGGAARRTISSGRAICFPKGRLDQDLQQVDLRERNSWRLLLAEVSSVELLETQLVNAVAPFVLNARLKPLHAAHARARQAHRQRVGGRRAVLPPLQDHAASAHEHGQGRAEHDDAHLRRRLPRATAST